ncbi:SurA N-terminal domain-containing protein [Devosia sp. A8/3-2]|nr:SurA N-terminal domain-containing protein [Devosia sp. A8/3-2]
MGAFLLVGVAGFGINNVITDTGTNTVARVGNEEINSREFLRAYQSQMNQVAQRLGSVPTQQEAVSPGIPSMVLQSPAQDAALNQMANNFGLGVSEQKLSEMLREDPSFAGTLGTFDPAAFSQVLQQSGLTEAEYFADRGKAAQRQQLVLSLFGDTKLSATASNSVNRYAADQRTMDYFCHWRHQYRNACRADRSRTGRLSHRAPGRIPHCGNPHRADARAVAGKPG